MIRMIGMFASLMRNGIIGNIKIMRDYWNIRIIGNDWGDEVTGDDWEH
jgi:hypothetical protein